MNISPLQAKESMTVHCKAKKMDLLSVFRHCKKNGWIFSANPLLSINTFYSKSTNNYENREKLNLHEKEDKHIRYDTFRNQQ